MKMEQFGIFFFKISFWIIKFENERPLYVFLPLWYTYSARFLKNLQFENLSNMKATEDFQESGCISLQEICASVVVGALKWPLPSITHLAPRKVANPAASMRRSGFSFSKIFFFGFSCASGVPAGRGAAGEIFLGVVQLRTHAMFSFRKGDYNWMS